MITTRQMLYESVFSVFQSKNCELLTSEEEYALLTQTKKIPKLRYVASCGHEHSVHFNVFKSRNTGVICPVCCCKKHGEMKHLANQLHPMPMSITHFNEERCIDYFINLIKSEYDCKKTFEGCLADLTIKPKNQPNDLWLQIQVKTNAVRLRTYSFNNTRKTVYNDCIMLCICWEDKKMWLFDGNSMNLSTISIGFNKSKYDVNEATSETIIEKLNHHYSTFNLFKFEDSNSPTYHLGKKEMEFKQLRVKNVMCDFMDVSNYLHHDFMITDKKVQEKIGSRVKNASALFKLTKSNGRIDKVRKFIPYDIGDNDLYWLHFPDKKHFCLLPEAEVMDKNGKIKRCICITLHKETQIPKNENWNKYLFDYANVDYERFNEILDQ